MENWVRNLIFIVGTIFIIFLFIPGRPSLVSFLDEGLPLIVSFIAFFILFFRIKKISQQAKNKGINLQNKSNLNDFIGNIEKSIVKGFDSVNYTPDENNKNKFEK